MFREPFRTRVLAAMKHPLISFMRKAGPAASEIPALAKPVEREIIEFYSGKEPPKKVKQDFAVIAKKTVPLYTGSLLTCVALIAVEKRENGKHLMAHASDGQGVKKAVKLAMQKIRGDCEIYARQGKYDNGLLETLVQELRSQGFYALVILTFSKETEDEKFNESKIEHVYGTFVEFGLNSVCTQGGRMYEMRKNQAIGYPSGRSEFDLRGN
ncbi:MAG: hypothetical protein WCT52_04210 [Candidatus Micrarchaeia archaeon]